MKVLWTFLLAASLLLPMGIGQAQEPNTREDNACYAGGSMAGKCDTAWEWICGYYLARWESAGGWTTLGNSIIDSCQSVLPPKPTTTDAAGASVTERCKNYGLGGAIACVRSDGIGFTPGGTYFYLHVMDGDDCSDTYNGYDLFNFVTVAGSDLEAIFGEDVLASLGWVNLYCFYPAPGAPL